MKNPSLTTIGAVAPDSDRDGVRARARSRGRGIGSLAFFVFMLAMGIALLRRQPDGEELAADSVS